MLEFLMNIVHTKFYDNTISCLGNTERNTKLESDIDKPERWLSSGKMLCERLLYPIGELNALGPSTQDPH